MPTGEQTRLEGLGGYLLSFRSLDSSFRDRLSTRTQDGVKFKLLEDWSLNFGPNNGVISSFFSFPLSFPNSLTLFCRSFSVLIYL